MWDADMDRCRELGVSNVADTDYFFRGGSLQLSTNEERYLQGGGTAISNDTTTACAPDETNDCVSNEVNCRNEGSLINHVVGMEELYLQRGGPAISPDTTAACTSNKINDCGFNEVNCGNDGSLINHVVGIEECYSLGGGTAISADTSFTYLVNETNGCGTNEVNCGIEGSSINHAVGIEESLPLDNCTAFEDVGVEQKVLDIPKSIYESQEIENNSSCLARSKMMLRRVEVETKSHVIIDKEGDDKFSSEKNGLIDDKDAILKSSQMLYNNSCGTTLNIEPVHVLSGQEDSEAGHLSGNMDDKDSLGHVAVTLSVQNSDEVLGLNGEIMNSYVEEKNDQVFSLMESKDGFENDIPRTSSIPEMASLLLAMSSNCRTDESSSLHLSNLCSITNNLPLGVDSGAPVTIPLVRRRNPARDASFRKSGKAQKAKSNVRKSKKASKLCTSLIEVLRATSSIFTKKRRYSKRLHISVWGSRENLFEKFKGDYEPLHPNKKGLKKGRSRKGKKGPVRLPNQASSTKTEIVMEQSDHHLSLVSGSHNSVTFNSNDSIGSLTPANVAKCKFETGGSISSESPCWSKHLKNQTPQNGDRDQESSLAHEVSGKNTLRDCHEIQTHIVNGGSVDVADSKLLLDPNTSPDSVVIHPPVDSVNVEDEYVNLSSIESSSKGGLMEYSVCNSGTLVVEKFSEAASSVSLQYTRRQASGKREKRSARLNIQDDIKAGERGCPLSDYSSEGTSLDPLNLNKNEKTHRKSYGRRKKSFPAHRTNGMDSKNVENPNFFQTENSTREKEICNENRASPSGHLTIRDTESTILQTLPSTSSGQLEKSNGRSNNTVHRRKQKGAGRKMDRSKRSASKGGSKCRIPHVQSILVEKSQRNDTFEGLIEKTSHFICDVDNSLSSRKAVESIAACNVEMPAMGSNDGLEDHVLRKRAAWVCCDDCYKWRSIAVELADAIDELGCGWTCKDNKDKTFADCSIPQEKTNAEINAELEISDDSSEEDLYTEKRLTSVSDFKPPAIQQSAWVPIDSNIYLHRASKSQTIDEIMVCQCKPPKNGSLGCGDECLNRMLNIECTAETCPCGNLCSNQQFQKREYARFKYYRCGKKGFGLKLSEDVRQGQFLIEYVGEVLDVVAHEARQREYAARGQKHFYFMTLNGNEVIDACAKGNLGRFINHSCEPNCRTEKWMINGEVCVGLFAMHDIKKGEEVTFDYNYVRVFGAAAKRCLCGSKKCRGYIGSDSSNNEMLIHSDSDEEHPEPMMISQNGERIVELAEENSESTDLLSPLYNEEKSNAEDIEIPKVNFSLEKDNTLHGIPPVDPVSDGLISALNNVVQESTEVISVAEKSEASRSLSDLKSSHSSSDKKKRRCKTKKSMVHKEKPPSSVPLAQPALYRSGHHEGVEEKLNELLDSRGGINKHRDATKGYLKLLVFSATSGDKTKSEISQSTRDISLILEALLKTKSRTVLVDLINKNGLQLLHNIMKQNRRNFSRIPVIRKLLKVLEFLASKEIITTEHISYLPSNTGVQSLKESILKLTYHSDVQVHQMARNFRDRWLPRKPKSTNSSDRDFHRLSSKRQMSNWPPQYPPKRVHVDHTVGSAQEVNPTRRRKGPSRWDQRQWPIPEVNSQADSDPQTRDSTAAESTFEEVPPGFGPPPQQPLIGTELLAIRSSALMGQAQAQYRAHLSVSYGIPLTLAEQLGTAADQDQQIKSQRQPSWEVAPGMPFYPFPPLPSIPRS